MTTDTTDIMDVEVEDTSKPTTESNAVSSDASAQVENTKDVDSTMAENTQNTDNEEKVNISSINNSLPPLCSQASCIPIAGPNPVLLAHSAITDFFTEITKAEITAKDLYDQHLKQQQLLLREFVVNSLRTMHQFNNDLEPIHQTLSSLKKPLEDILLSYTFIHIYI